MRRRSKAKARRGGEKWLWFNRLHDLERILPSRDNTTGTEVGANRRIECGGEARRWRGAGLPVHNLERICHHARDNINCTRPPPVPRICTGQSASWRYRVCDALIKYPGLTVAGGARASMNSQLLRLASPCFASTDVRPSNCEYKRPSQQLRGGRARPRKRTGAGGAGWQSARAGRCIFRAIASDEICHHDKLLAVIARYPLLPVAQLHHAHTEPH
jgi:hypothetical protein